MRPVLAVIHTVLATVARVAARGARCAVTRLAAGTAAGARRVRTAAGQGTVEYVALILLVALVMAGVVAALKGFRTTQGKDLADVIIGKIKDAVGKVQF